MDLALDAPTLIPQFAPFAFEQIIIAGGDEDVTAGELFDWVAPLLAGIPQGRWMSCQLEFGPDGFVIANYRAGGSDTVVSVTIDSTAEATRMMLDQLPVASSMTMILLNDFSSQVVTLLDGIARWLNIYDVDEQALTPVLRLLGSFQTILSTT